MTWRLVGPDGEAFDSACRGTLGGHRKTRIYGRLDCVSARRALARGGYKAQRVFFLDETAAVTAGYRPCAVCLPEAYARWRRSATGRTCMKVQAIKNDPSRTFQDLADIQALLSLPGVDEVEVRRYFEQHGLAARFEELQRARGRS